MWKNIYLYSVKYKSHISSCLIFLLHLKFETMEFLADVILDRIEFK